ncbi:MAG: tetratricopeptide repeat protein [Deltaproteobacteria bacterium]|nr:tetratricopeptide repeat protein [Deltaproteobacteria bacterium]
MLLGLGAAALALGTAAVAARTPAKATAGSGGAMPRRYVPADGSATLAVVPPRDAREVRLRKVLHAEPERVDVAVQLARLDVQRNRTLSDPRYLGRAQATLARWWHLAAPPPDVLLLRAVIRQSLHDFTGARADLDRLVAADPGDTEAQLTRAVVSTIVADYRAARQSCDAIAGKVSALVAATCTAAIDAITGRAGEAYARLAQVVAASDGEALQLRTWALTTLAEIAIMRGDPAAAVQHLRAVVELDPDDAYGRAALADVYLGTGRAAEASALLDGREQIDNLLVRRAIAEHVTSGPDRTRLVGAMRDRIAAAAERGDRIHLREEARFTLEVENDPRRALAIALEDFAVQKELADARLVAAAAFAANDLAAAEPVRTWATLHRVDDAQLRHWLGDRP